MGKSQVNGTERYEDGRCVKATSTVLLINLKLIHACLDYTYNTTVCFFATNN